jgi:hypothetical protein
MPSAVHDAPGEVESCRVDIVASTGVKDLDLLQGHPLPQQTEHVYTLLTDLPFQLCVRALKMRSCVRGGARIAVLAVLVCAAGAGGAAPESVVLAQQSTIAFDAQYLSAATAPTIQLVRATRGLGFRV